MSELTTGLRQAEVPAEGVRLYWLGQAGFAFRTAEGKRIFLDPYLSDACERLHGFKRLSLPAMRPEEDEADWIILTHEHTDHLDPDAIPVIARNNPHLPFRGARRLYARIGGRRRVGGAVCLARTESPARPGGSGCTHGSRRSWRYLAHGAGSGG
ncbi:MAG: MBL fold metallo-hydrolase [bacterium]